MIDVYLLYEQALKIATKAHEGQKRKFGADAGKDYIVHPIRVARRLSGLPKVVGILHDVLEDTPVTDEDLREEGIPEGVIEALKLVTKEDGEHYEAFISRIAKQWVSKTGQMAIKVKIADLEDNMSDLKEGSMKDKYRLAKRLLSMYAENGYMYRMG